MSDEKTTVSDKASEFARNIWLAGVGAYGRAVGEAQDRLEKAGVETPKLFRDLVKAGAALEEEARSAISAGQEARNSVEERINRVRENFRLQLSGRGDDLQALHEKIDRLAAELAELKARFDGPVVAGRKKAPGGTRAATGAKATGRASPRTKSAGKKAPVKAAVKARAKSKSSSRHR